MHLHWLPCQLCTPSRLLQLCWVAKANMTVLTHHPLTLPEEEDEEGRGQEEEDNTWIPRHFHPHFARRKAACARGRSLGRRMAKKTWLVCVCQLREKNVFSLPLLPFPSRMRMVRVDSINIGEVDFVQASAHARHTEWGWHEPKKTHLVRGKHWTW